MNRRQFVASSAGVAALSQLSNEAEAAPAASGKRALMKLGCQSGGYPTNDERLRFFARFGVTHFCGYAKEEENVGYPSVESLSDLRDRAEKNKLTLAMVAPSFLASSHVDRTKRPAIMLADDPERMRDIEKIQNLIKNCGKAGVPSIKYNMSLLGVLRTERTPGRGGAMYSTWRLKEAKDPGLTKAGKVNADQFWERIDFYLKNVVPVANEYKVRIACHPHDPGVPPSGYQGIDRVLGRVEGLKKFVSMHESPYHGLNFCQGTVSEMLQDPGKEIFDVIKYFGEKKKIFNVHFRNIRGKRDDFQETYPDEGDIDFVKAMKLYRDLGYDGMMMPDHVPQHSEDRGGSQGFAFAYGHIRALIQAVDQMA